MKQIQAKGSPAEIVKIDQTGAAFEHCTQKLEEGPYVRPVCRNRMFGAPTFGSKPIDPPFDGRHRVLSHDCSDFDGNLRWPPPSPVVSVHVHREPPRSI